MGWGQKRGKLDSWLSPNYYWHTLSEFGIAVNPHLHTQAERQNSPRKRAEDNT